MCIFYEFKQQDFVEKNYFSHIFPKILEKDVNSYILYKGLKVYPDFGINIITACTISINLIKKDLRILQGLDVSTNNVKIMLPNGIMKKNFAYMYSKKEFEQIWFQCIPNINYSKIKSVSKNWIMLENIWEIKYEDNKKERCKWAGNFGVVVEQRQKNCYYLYFNSGESENNDIYFDDLIIEVKIEGEYEAKFQCSKMDKMEKRTS